MAEMTETSFRLQTRWKKTETQMHFKPSSGENCHQIKTWWEKIPLLFLFYMQVESGNEED